MKIEVKNVKYSDFNSHETLCFQATVYKDGKRWCIASNEGHGGCTNFEALKGSDGTGGYLWDQIKAFDAKQDMIKSKTIPDFEFKNDLEVQVNDLVNTWLVTRDLKKVLKKTTALKPNGEMVSWTGKHEPDFAAQVKKRNPDYVILNDLPFDEALEIYRTH